MGCQTPAWTVSPFVFGEGGKVQERQPRPIGEGNGLRGKREMEATVRYCHRRYERIGIGEILCMARPDENLFPLLAGR